MKNEVPGGNAQTNENKSMADEQLIERLPADTAVDLERSDHKFADPIPNKINGVDAPWATPPKRSKKPLVIAIAVIMALVVAGVAAWYFLVYAPSQTKEDKVEGVDAATRFASAQALVSEVSAGLKGATMKVNDVTGIGAADGSGNYAYGVPAYRSDGAVFHSLPLQITGSAYTGNSVVAADNYAELKSFFEKNKFVKIYSDDNTPGTVSDLGGQINYISYAEYESGNLLCAIRHADASSTSIKAHIASIGCGEKASYKQASDGLKAIHAAYIKGESDVSNELVFGFLREGEGADGYKYATIYQEDENVTFTDRDDYPASLTGLYYQAPGASEWTFFTITSVDSYPNCALYDTETLKKAFKGYECYDESLEAESVVK